MRRMIVWVLLIALTLVALPAQAHTEKELTAWLMEFERMKSETPVPSRPSLAFPIVSGWNALLEDMRDRHPCSEVLDTPCSTVASTRHEEPSSNSGSTNRGMGSNVEQWRSLVEAYFGANATNTALCLMKYESGGNPTAQNPSGASGLMQVMPFWASKFGYSTNDLFIPEVNLEIAAALYRADGWGHWSPWNRGLCR